MLTKMHQRVERTVRGSAQSGACLCLCHSHTGHGGIYTPFPAAGILQNTAAIPIIRSMVAPGPDERVKTKAADECTTGANSCLAIGLVCLFARLEESYAADI